jgi:hypothetical protein
MHTCAVGVYILVDAPFFSLDYHSKKYDHEDSLPPQQRRSSFKMSVMFKSFKSEVPKSGQPGTAVKLALDSLEGHSESRETTPVHHHWF